MSRMPWNNESRICRWPDGWGGYSGPTKEEKLRKRYPELQKKWKEYIRYDEIYDDMMMQELDTPGESSASDKEWKSIKANLKKAKKDYEFLEKMLWDY